MKLIFTGDPTELERGEGLSRLSTTVYGVTFPMSAEVDVTHLPEKLQQKLLNNPHFRAAGVDAPAAPRLILPAMPAAAPVEAPSAESAAVADEEEAAEAAAHAARAAKRKKG